MTGLRSCCYVLLGALVGLALTGCGGGGETLVTVTGKVHEGGQPVAIKDFYEGRNCLQVEFFRLDDSGNLAPESFPYSQDVGEDGTFEIRGPEGKGIPAGKYRVAVYRLSATEGMDEDTGEDLFEGKYGKENSKFEFDVAANQTVDIDLAAAGGA
jgi:hypothetical protein